MSFVLIILIPNTSKNGDMVVEYNLPLVFVFSNFGVCSFVVFVVTSAFCVSAVVLAVDEGIDVVNVVFKGTTNVVVSFGIGVFSIVVVMGFLVTESLLRV